MTTKRETDSPHPDVPPAQPIAASRGFLRRRAGIAAMIAGGGVTAILIWASGGVSGSNEAAAVALSHRDIPALDGKFIRFSDAFAQRTRISSVLVQAKQLAPIVNVTGTVATDARKFAAVGARITGRVRRIFKIEGDEVRRGDVLAAIESAELGRAEAQVLATRAKEMAAEAQHKRESYLADAHVASAREAELAKAEYEATRAGRVAAERTVKALGGDLGGDIGILALRSPIAGAIIASKVSRGQTVGPTDTLFEIADLSTLWVELSVFERDLAGVRVGNTVEIGARGRAGGPIQGQVAHVGEMIDLSTRSAEVRVVIPGVGSGLRPGQSVEARIHLKVPNATTLTVPRVAVTRIDGKPMVLIMVGPGIVEPREVTLGPEDADDVTVLGGLADRERVIVDGLFALKSELFR